MANTYYDEVASALAPITALAESVRSALGSTQGQMGNKTWDGAAADAWAKQWDARRQQIEGILQDAEDQCRQLLQAAAKTHGAK